ncbi:uncharacterized protein BcabD6B2_32700 [Babesia caballi]|uniref:Uncharacterized protein n=1 Tax=Babesia caballi TaxID=5871 RepID=A0AAV4LVE4_BABCB|nr:hypothetical protein, conserved [Babesia caballi]
MDEVTYTLKAHQCILNPYKPNLSVSALQGVAIFVQCYLVLEEMKQALVHPAVIRMNELLINSYFELEELKCQPPAQLWQNFAKATWQTSFRLTRQRVRKLREALSKMDPADVMRLSDEDVAALAQDEFLHAAFSATLAMDEIHDEPIEIGAADAVTAEDHEATMVGELPRAAGAAALSDGIAAEVDEFAFHSDADEAESDFDMEDEFENDIEHEFAYAHRHVRSRGRGELEVEADESRRYGEDDLRERGGVDGEQHELAVWGVVRLQHDVGWLGDDSQLLEYVNGVREFGSAEILDVDLVQEHHVTKVQERHLQRHVQCTVCIV